MNKNQMAAIIIIGTRAMYGSVDGPFTFEGFPLGAHLRLRMRPDDFAQVFVRVKETGLMQSWFVHVSNGVITPAILQATNVRSVEGLTGTTPRLIEDASTPEELQLAKEEMQTFANLPEDPFTHSP